MKLSSFTLVAAKNNIDHIQNLQNKGVRVRKIDR